MFGGGTSPSLTNVINFITIASAGNASDFGDLKTANAHYGAASNSIIGVWAGGYDNSNPYNHIDFVTIATTGNAADWGDTFRDRKYHAGCSDSHGGLAE